MPLDASQAPAVATPEPGLHELELLIREARERQRRRRIGAAAAVAAASAAALALYSVLGAGTSHATSASEPGRAAVTGPCDRSSGWSLESGSAWSEPTGQHTATIQLIREGSSACTLRGYPAIVLRDSDGLAIPFRYTHRGDMVVRGGPAKTVRIGGHGSAFFVFNKYRCDLRATRIAKWLFVRLPGVRGSLRLRMPRYPIVDYCSSGGPSATIAVSPIVRRMSDAAAPHP